MQPYPVRHSAAVKLRRVTPGEREELAQRLGAALSGPLPGPVEVRELERLTEGASRETWAFEAQDARGETHRLILRRDFAGGLGQNPDALIGREDALDRPGEFALLERLHALGLPVPRPVLLPEPEHDLGASFVMERLPGETSARRIVRGDAFAEVRPRLVGQLGEALARIHALGKDDLPPMPQRPVTDRLATLRELLDLAPAPRPTLEMALRWAHENAPAPGPLRLVHGDFRTSNYAVGPEGLLGLFDWEFSHLGEPVEDLGFVCLHAWRFGADEREVSGVGDRDDLYRAYERAGGTPVDPEAVRFWEVMSGLAAAGVFMWRGSRPRGEGLSVEGAAIGRRVAELEYDLLGLIE